MAEIQASDPLEVLRDLHGRLDAHYQALHEARVRLETPSPVFALEHDLSDEDLQALVTAVKASTAMGLAVRYRHFWLPFVVYASEQGYAYVGDDYWPPFGKATPGWRYEHRAWLKAQFLKFAASYGGAKPTGAFAQNFTIIAWPITHAVLPIYLQRHLAQLLYEFRTGLSTALLNSPDTLGIRLAARAHGYTERFRIFCENTALLGQVAAALLAGADEESPYLVRSTLHRIIDGLSKEHQAKQWLAAAQQSANKVRTSGLEPTMRAATSSSHQHMPRATDPRLVLRYLDGAWNAFAKIPDLTSISERLPHVYEELRDRRAVVSGARKPVAGGGLVYGGEEVRLESWPDPGQPFVQLERGSDAVNQLLADQCVAMPGPWWLFRRKGAGLAIEVRGRFLRPGHSYILLGRSDLPGPNFEWAEPTPTNVAGVSAYRLNLPNQLGDEDVKRILELGLSLLSSVAIRPVGVVASAWDGEGAVEWLAGEPAILGICSELTPTRCLLTVEGQRFPVTWPAGQSELFLRLDGLDVGSHEVAVALVGEREEPLSKGSVLVTIRDPQVRPENATVGEGIRMLTSPARPTLAELWNERASVVIDGPIDSRADLVIHLRGDAARDITALKRRIKLPLGADAWSMKAKSIRSDPLFKKFYDEAESCILVAARDGVGFALITCERGYLPLRWRFKKEHDGVVTARLTDRTDGGSTRVEFYAVESPLRPVNKNYAPDKPIPLPPSGGLLRAISDHAEAAVIAPTNPSVLCAAGKVRASVTYGESSPAAAIMRLADAHRMWQQAETPADPFAARNQGIALEAIARTIPMLVCGAHWAKIERQLETADEAADHLEEMQNAVGVSEAHRALAVEIGCNLYKWLAPGALLEGFYEVIGPTLGESGINGHPTAARFLLTLAGRCGFVTDWDPTEAKFFLERIVASPVLLRAARFAVLGTRAISDLESAARGF